MDPNELDDWFTKLEDRLDLSESEREAIAVLRDNDLIFDAMAEEFVLVSEFEEWIKHDRAVHERKLTEIVSMNLEWQQRYERQWAPRLKMLEQVEAVGIPVTSFSAFVTKVLELAVAQHGTRFVTPNGRYFHRRECKWLTDIPDAFLSSLTHEEAVGRDYKPCASCRA